MGKRAALVQKVLTPRPLMQVPTMKGGAKGAVR